MIQDFRNKTNRLVKYRLLHIELLTLPQLMMYYLSTKDLELPVGARDFYFFRRIFMVREYKTFEQQIEILKNRNLIINDESMAKEILTIHNYYNVINGYKELFCCRDENNNEKFINGTTFDELYALYCFDRELRSIIFKYTLQIENTLRTLISYVFSKYHGVEN